MTVVELLHQLTAMPLMAEVVFCDTDQMVSVEVGEVEQMTIEGLPPICYLGPKPRLELVS